MAKHARTLSSVLPAPPSRNRSLVRLLRLVRFARNQAQPARKRASRPARYHLSIFLLQLRRASMQPAPSQSPLAPDPKKPGIPPAPIPSHHPLYISLAPERAQSPLPALDIQSGLDLRTYLSRCGARPHPADSFLLARLLKSAAFPVDSHRFFQRSRSRAAGRNRKESRQQLCILPLLWMGAPK